MAKSGVKTNLVLDEELDTLNGSGGSLGDGGGDTTHCCPMLATDSLFPSSYRRGCAGAINALSRRMAPLHHAIRCNVLRKSTTKPGMPMNSFLLWLQWLSARWSQAMPASPYRLADGGAQLTRHPWSGFQQRQTSCRWFWGGIRLSGEDVDGDDGWKW